ncbi:hypothetical protein VP01_1535g4, partial [Puccinia sorghi]
MLDSDNQNLANQKPSTTAESINMERLETTILKTAIEAIPLRNLDNYALWKNQKGLLTRSQDVQLRTILTSRLDSSIHTNSISNYFASSQSSNRARVFKELLRLRFNTGDIPGFIT